MTRLNDAAKRLERAIDMRLEHWKAEVMLPEVANYVRYELKERLERTRPAVREELANALTDFGRAIAEEAQPQPVTVPMSGPY